MEQWKEIPGFEGYMASFCGKIWSKKRNKIMKVCKTRPDKKGYYQLSLFASDNERITRRVHQLVCLAFHGLPPTDAHTVNHKDGNKLNNCADNLEWATRSQQNFHRFYDLHQIENHPRGHGVHFRANYTDDEIRLIRKLYAEGHGYHKVTAMLGNKTSWVAVQCIIKRKTYAHVLD